MAQILSEGGSVQQPAQRLVEALPRALEWDGASVWMVERDGGELACRAAWASPQSGLLAMIEAQRSGRIRRGEGFVGRAWEQSGTIWLGDGEEIEPAAEGAHTAAAGDEGAGLLPGTLARAERRARHTADDRRRERRCPRALASRAPASRPGGGGHCRHPDRPDRRTHPAPPGADRDSPPRSRARRLLPQRGGGPAPGGPDGIIQRANRAELELLGYTESEYVGHHVAEFHVDQEQIAAILDRLGRGEDVRDEEVRLRAKDGSIRHVVIDSNGRWEDGRFVHSRCFTRDVTDRKNAEINLRFLHQSSQTLAELVDYRTTLERIAQLAVPDFADWCTVQILGPTGIELVGWAHRDPARSQLVREAFARHPVDPDSDYGIAMVLRTGKSELVRVITDEMLVRAARTESHLRLLRELRLSSSMTVPLTAKKGVLGTIRFVAAESGRRYTKADLETAKDLAVQASIAIDNALLYEEAREADRRKDEFLATLSHELRNPLAPIRSGIDLLTLDPAAREKTVELMRRQIEHLVRLADDLLDISRITHGKVELRRESVELFGIVTAAVATVREAADEKGHDLAIVLPEEAIWLDADPVRVLQVIENLLSNAVKYTNSGGSIEVAVSREDGFAAMRVRDDGIGIDGDLMAQIFEPFTQASSVSTARAAVSASA